MKRNTKIKRIGLLFACFLFFSSSAFAVRLTDLSGGLTEEELTGMVEVEEEDEETTEEDDSDVPAGKYDPVIYSIEIQEARESKKAKVNLNGKNLLPTKGSVSVSMPGGSVGSYSYQSPTLLIFNLPDNVRSGDVTVTTSSELGTKRTSKGFPFEFHPPKILFVTGDDGIAPGKTIKIWGNHFDGIFYRKAGKSKIADVKNGYLHGGGVSTGGNLSVIEITLPEENFSKDFWVERNCDTSGDNC